jgi:hypothetical protein
MPSCTTTCRPKILAGHVSRLFQHRFPIFEDVAAYAIGGWERSPSAKQAKWAMEAYKAAEEAGVLSLSSEIR